MIGLRRDDDRACADEVSIGLRRYDDRVRNREGFENAAVK